MKKIEEKHEWINKLYDISEDKFSSELIYPMVDAIPTLFEKESFEEVDKILLEIDYKRLSMPFLISLMRITSSGKISLKQWDETLQKVYGVLEKRGENPERNLKGIL